MRVVICAGASALPAGRVRKNSTACMRSSRYDLTVWAEAFFSRARWRKNSASASSMAARTLSNPRARRRRRLRAFPRLFPDFFDHHCGVEPCEAKSRIGGLFAERIDEVLAAAVVVNEHIALVTLDQGLDVQLLSHGSPLLTVARAAPLATSRYRPV